MYDRPFRWWVQSVMPLVFDDSLSYYEVLAKLTKYIEGLTGDVDQIEKILGTIEGIEDVTQFTEMLESIKAEIGNLSDLSTQSKTNLVSAINEVALKADIAYWKPPTGIPESDLSQGVQDKLNKTATATEYIINNVKLKPSPSNNSPADLGLGTYSVPAGGIPWGTLSQDVRDRIENGSGGEGGTKDYTELNNKPQINGHTLNAGNNTTESLGLGTYSKPTAGIPESDLSAEVQEKLNTSGGIADSETSFVATRDYEAGELIYINGVLYKTKYKILSGTNLIPGNNIEVTDISNEIEKINSDIEALQSGSGPDSWNLKANVTNNSTEVYTRFFEYFNAIGGENYLFIITPSADNSYYQLGIFKKDGTAVHYESVNQSPNEQNQFRFTFTPTDTGEYYCGVRKWTAENVRSVNISVSLEYTQSQGISELWNKINEATQLEPRVEAVETLVEQQQEEIAELSNDSENINNSVNYLSEALNADYKIIKGHYCDNEGKIVPGEQYNLICYKVESGGIIEELRSTDVLVYAFYANEPEIGSVSYNQSRIVTPNLHVLNNIAVPTGVSWIAIRGFSNRSVITITPKSSIIRNIEKQGVFNKGIYNDNIDNVKDSSMRYIPASNSSSPLHTLSSGELHTFELVTNTYMQIFYGLTADYKGKRYVRAYINAAWNNWITYDINESEVNTFLKWAGTYTGDINDVKDNSIRYISSSIADSPFNGVSACVLITNEAASDTFMQTALGFSASYKGVRYTRTFVQGAWTAWVSYDSGKFASNPIYHAFGDSVMYGAKWIAAEGSPGYQIVRTPEINRIPTRIANAIGAERNFYNNGVSGAALAGQGSNRIINKIRDTDMNGVKLITVSGGRNDSSNQLGDINSTINDGTICGAVKEIIEYLQANYPKAQIVWIGVTPHGDADNNVFTWVTPAGWTLNSFDDAVSAVCAEYCVPYVNWKKCTYMMNWSTFSSVAGNYVHPDNDESYLQIGNYIAGQVANYYRG